MQRIAVIGGTGMTGECAVDHAIEKGLTVRLLYRTEATVPERFKSKVQLVKGDATNYDDVKRLIDGVDGVCVVLGTRNKLEATTELSRGTENLIKAMKEEKLTKFSIVMSSFLWRPLNEVPAVFHRLNEEHKRMLDLTKASGLDWIAILPPHIADEPASGYTVVYDEAPGRLVSKYDLGKFIVDSLDQPEHYGKVCGIGKSPKSA
ncbi:GL23232 [Drosophila persimilis]|uniref:Flavin reductase (NADPH) n=2 Tax=pseudoobscura subgroup TaxID=32358 RepID=A0A6I8UP22_DROPS|nr:flavin reductase (NADPH) [Drosophila pseudoobscura]XP_002013745.1 flavin reductase (NADPH) [Drosophila persimilis]XP_017143562.1 flavin reductase (NADPH) [Drosophila miranda]EDW24731.1 GL23232 [Drosophila persimilis]